MAAHYSLSIIHPSIDLLKKLSRLLHFIAAAFIALNAFHQLAAHEGNSIICYTQLLIAVDIFILIFWGAGIMEVSARPGVIFRAIEALTFLGIAITLKAALHPVLALLHAAAALCYGFLCYREWRIAAADAMVLNDSGILIPSFLSHARLSWLHIKRVIAGYDCIIIETVRDQQVKFALRNNLKIEELEQINDFCIFHARLSS